MQYANINVLFANRFPELSTEIEKVNLYWKGDTPPSHILFAEVLNQNGFMHNLLMQNADIQLISRLFSFYEEMASGQDVEVRNLLQSTILEYLWGDFKLLSIAYKHMLPKTKVLCDELQAYFQPFEIQE